MTLGMLAQIGSRPTPIAPTWLVLSLALVSMVLIAGHLQAVQVADMPESRRRIRSAADMVMLVLSALLAYAFGIATPAQPRLFTLAWSACVGLLFVVLLLAFIDSANNMRMHRREMRVLREQSRATREKLHRLTAEAGSERDDA